MAKKKKVRTIWRNNHVLADNDAMKRAAKKYSTPCLYLGVPAPLGVRVKS